IDTPDAPPTTIPPCPLGCQLRLRSSRQVTTLYFASPIRSSRSNRWACEPDDQVKGTTALGLARLLPSVIGSSALAGVPKFRKRGPLIGHYDAPNTLSAPPQRG